VLCIAIPNAREDESFAALLVRRIFWKLSKVEKLISTVV
jgi:hypothetical protein